MVSIVKELFIHTYNIAKGRDIQSGIALSHQDAKKEAKKLLHAIGTLAIAAGGFFALSTLQQKISPTHSILGPCVLTAGCLALSQNRISPLVTHASAMTAGLFIMQGGVGNLVLSPLIQTVKAALHWIIQPHMSLNLLSSCVSGIAFGFLRSMGGLVSLGVSMWVMDSASQKGPKSRHPLDRGVNYLSKNCASGLVALFGYKKYLPPAEDQSVRPITK